MYPVEYPCDISVNFPNEQILQQFEAKCQKQSILSIGSTIKGFCLKFSPNLLEELIEVKNGNPDFQGVIIIQ